MSNIFYLDLDFVFYVSCSNICDKIYLGGLIMKTFHKRLKQLRLNKKKMDTKYTQGYMAEITGVARLFNWKIRPTRCFDRKG